MATKGRVLVISMLIGAYGCAPFSPDVKYLYAPDVKTCAADTWGCAVKEPHPKFIELKPAPPEAEAGNTLSLPALETIQEIRPDSASASTPASGTPPTEIKTVTVTQATKYVRDMEREYAGAKAEYGSINSSFGTLLIPAGASALALGAEGAGATAVTALGFGSAAVLGEGYWLSNSTREKVYVTGANALECLIGTMQPFDVEQIDFNGLKEDVGYFKKPASEGMEGQQHDVLSGADRLTQSLVSAQSDPEIASSSQAKATLCYVERALLAADAGGEAASKAYDAAVKYDQFSTRLAGKAMINVAMMINNNVSGAMTKSEPDLHTLAANLNSTIPSSAQALAGISSASSATSAAVAAVQKANISKPPPLKPPAAPNAVVKPIKIPPPGTPGNLSSEALKTLDKLRGDAEKLLWENSKLNWWTKTVVDLTPDDIKPKTEACTNLFADPGAPPELMTLNPDGYIELTAGGQNVDVTISGGKLPYAVRLVGNSTNGVLAATAYDSGKASIVLSATDDARADSYPLMVNDSTGAARLLTLVVRNKPPAADGPDCSDSAVTDASKVLDQVKADAEDAMTAAQEAAKFANDASKQKAAAIKAKGSVVDARKAARLAATAAYKASIEAATAQKKAGDAAKTAGTSNDSTVTFYVSEAKDAAASAAASSQSAGKDAVEAAKASP